MPSTIANPTNTVGRLVQAQPTKRPRFLLPFSNSNFPNPTNAVGGLFTLYLQTTVAAPRFSPTLHIETVEGAGRARSACRQSLNDPPTALVGSGRLVFEKRAVGAVCRQSLKDPTTALVGLVIHRLSSLHYQPPTLLSTHHFLCRYQSIRAGLSASRRIFQTLVRSSRRQKLLSAACRSPLFFHQPSLSNTLVVA